MKKQHFIYYHTSRIILFLLSVSTLSAQNNFGQSNDTLKVATYNVRIKTVGDLGNRAWTIRKKQVSQIINNYEFDVIGIQELANLKQEKDLAGLLKNYKFISKGRENTKGTTGERLAIAYDKKRFTVQNNGFFFLSESPEIVSRGWDAACNRICVWAELFDIETQKLFYFFNIHFDHIGNVARGESTKLLMHKINEISGEKPVMCVGDFNSTPSDSMVYLKVVSDFKDSRKSSATTPKGTINTYNGWDVKSTGLDENLCIDYIFVKKISVFSYSVLNDKFTTNSYPSDHFPVFIKCKLE